MAKNLLKTSPATAINKPIKTEPSSTSAQIASLLQIDPAKLTISNGECKTHVTNLENPSLASSACNFLTKEMNKCATSYQTAHLNKNEEMYINILQNMP